MNKHKHWVGLLLILLFISLACNIPVQRQVASISALELQQTLQSLERTKTPSSTLAEDPALSDSAAGVFQGLATATSAGEPVQTQETGQNSEQDAVQIYYAQSGDTLPTVSRHFGVEPFEITSDEALPPEAYLRPGQVLVIPRKLEQRLSGSAVLPDSEVVFSPSLLGFSVEDFVAQSGGYLYTYQENVKGETLSGAEIVQRVAELTSTNPRFLLAFLEFRSGWVLGQPDPPVDSSQPIGFNIQGQDGLYAELSLVANQLNSGYYNWRLGNLTDLKFTDKSTGRIHPMLNAGSVAVQRLFSFFYTQPQWSEALFGPTGFSALYQRMFGDPWERARVVEPLLPAGLEQPLLELPFQPGERWSLTGGPHYSWNAGSPRGALDFAPVTKAIGCEISPAWATAPAAGVVVRTGEGFLILDLDKDGHEQTGWVLFFLHLAGAERIPEGALVQADDRLGHPSCEGGAATGTHLHLARKYNGEWIPADGPIPLVLSGWESVAGEKNYAGHLQNEGQIVTANPGGTRTSIIMR
jgi:LysM repeat protein